MATAMIGGACPMFADYDRMVASYRMSVVECRTSLVEFRRARRELKNANREWQQKLGRLLDDFRVASLSDRRRLNW